MRSMMLCAALVLVLAPVAGAARQGVGKPPMPQTTAPARDGQAPPTTGKSILAGTVVAADSGKPVRRTRVGINNPAGNVSLSATTDDQGHFKFTDLPAGLYTVTASRPGFIDSIYGQKQAGSGRPGTPVTLLEAQDLENLSMPIARGGVITGTVLDDRGEPEFGAQVRAMRWVMRTGERSLVVGATASTDDRGQYRLTGLLPGDYIVSATSSEQPAASNEMAAVAKMRAAEISASGDPSAAAAIADLRALMARLSSDDPSKDPASGYAPVYYPGTTLAASAQAVVLGVSEERASIDVALQLVPMTRVSGTVAGAAGNGGSVQVTLTPTGTAVPLPGPRTVRMGSDGRFSFSAVQPGSYNVMATAPQGGDMISFKISGDGMAAAMANGRGGSGGAPEFTQLWATTDIVVDGRPMTPLALVLQPGLSVTGRIVASGAATPPDFTRMRINLAVIGNGPERSASLTPTSVDASGRFVITGVVPGHYRMNVAGVPPVWSIGSVITNGRDAMDFGLELKPGEDSAAAVVTLTDRSTTISGTLQDSNSRPASNYTVVAFALDAAYWLPNSRRIQATRPSTDGRYSFHGLPPGDYRLAVVPDVEPGQWFDPAWLRQIGTASVAVTLGPGATVTQDVRVR
jgi:uncharacterized protein (DUF2141 family)